MRTQCCRLHHALDACDLYSSNCNTPDCDAQSATRCRRWLPAAGGAATRRSLHSHPIADRTSCRCETVPGRHTSRCSSAACLQQPATPLTSAPLQRCTEPASHSTPCHCQPLSETRCGISLAGALLPINLRDSSIQHRVNATARMVDDTQPGRQLAKRAAAVVSPPVQRCICRIQREMPQCLGAVSLPRSLHSTAFVGRAGPIQSICISHQVLASRAAGLAAFQVRQSGAPFRLRETESLTD